MSLRRPGLVFTAVFLLMALFGAAAGGCSFFRVFQKPSPAPSPAKKLEAEPSITVYMHTTGEKRTMMFEDYLAGVVAGEMLPSWPLEALAAQAIVARTYTMERIAQGGLKKTRGTDVSTSYEEFQAYDARGINDNVRKAVAITRGQVLTYRGNLAKAWFHDASGGMTATPREGLGYKDSDLPYIKPVADVAAPEIQNPWKASFSMGEVAGAASSVSGKSPWPVNTVAIASKGPSGRAVTIRVGKVVVNAAELRLALGSTRMKSTLLDSLTVSNGQVVMQGRGFGHGVGLSQQGAKALATQGQKAAQIIARYYKDLTITQLWK